MYYHVTTAEGVIYETDDPHNAYTLESAIVGAKVRAGSLVGLRERSREIFGNNWLRGPSKIDLSVWAA